MFSHEDCKRIQPMLDAYYDGELEAAELNLVDEHIGGCDACKRSLAAVEQLASSLRGLPKAFPSRLNIADNFEEILAAKAPKMEACEKIQPLLGAYFDSELVDTEKQAVAAHLGECRNCQGDVRDISIVAGSLRELKPIEPPYDLSARIEDVLRKKNRVIPFKKPIVWGSLAAAAAAAVIGLALHLTPGGSTVAPNTVANQPSSVAAPTVAMVSPSAPTAGLGPQSVPVVVEHFDPKNPSTLHDAFQKVAQKIIADANDKSGMVAPIADKKTQPLVAEVAINASKNNAKHLTAQTGAKAVKTAYNEAAPEIALYDAGPQQTTAEALGISTDEDGLYAIKL